MTEGGHVGAIDLDRMRGLTKQFGGLFHVHLAQRLREHGIAVKLDKETGAAVLPDIPKHVCDEFSKRTKDARQAAQDYARDLGLDWDSMPKKRQIALLHRGIEERRHGKENDGGEFAAWEKQAVARGYAHRSQLGRRRPAPDLSQERRVELAVNAAEPLIAERLTRLGVEASCGDALVTEKALQVGDVHAQGKQARRHRMPEQMRVDALADLGCPRDVAHDLSDALTVSTCDVAPEPAWRLANSGPARRAPICRGSSCARSRRIGASRRLPPFP
jgi:hypothetical protein